MPRLKQLYAEQKHVLEQKVTGAASAMARHQKLSQLQQEIDYYELGDTISRQKIQTELAEIKEIEEEINRLTVQADEKRSKLMTYVFGAHGATLT